MKYKIVYMYSILKLESMALKKTCSIINKLATDLMLTKLWLRQLSKFKGGK